MKKCYALILVVVLMLTGCVSELNITEQESNMVAEYIAKTLLKYDKKYDEELIEEVQVTTLDESQTSKEQTTEETTEADNTNPSENNIPDKPVDSKKIVELSSILGNDKIEIKCVGYSIHDTYTDEQESFVIKSTQNRKLLVLQFIIKNTSNSVQRVDLLNSNVTFKLNVNDSDEYSPLLTFILSDISYYDFDLQPEKSREGVLVFDVDLSTANSISKLILDVVNSKGTEKAVVFVN